MFKQTKIFSLVYYEKEVTHTQLLSPVSQNFTKQKGVKNVEEVYFY